MTGKNILPKPKNPAQRIHLDELGSTVWNLFDGKHSIGGICEKLSTLPDMPEDSLEERTVLFAQQMFRQKYIKVYTKEDQEDSESISQ